MTNKQIKKALRKRRISLYTVAERANVTQPMVSMTLQGRRVSANVSDTALKLIEEFDNGSI